VFVFIFTFDFHLTIKPSEKQGSLLKFNASTWFLAAALDLHRVLAILAAWKNITLLMC